MLQKFKNVGLPLTKDAMKKITGGIVWPGLRDFKCILNNGTVLVGGCSDISGYGHTCCMNKYGTTNVEWGAYGCPYQVC